MAYARGHISGCHLTPAVSVGLVVGKRFPASELPAYAIAQVLGGVAGAGVLYLIASGKEGFTLAAGFAADGYAAHSPGGYALGSALLAEVVLTFMFLMIILGSTSPRAARIRSHCHRSRSDPHPFNRDPRDESVRQPGPAVFVGGWALQQLWLFWVAPIAGAVLAGAVYSIFSEAPALAPRSAAAA
jgi:aquaporin Z